MDQESTYRGIKGKFSDEKLVEVTAVEFENQGHKYMLEHFFEEAKVRIDEFKKKVEEAHLFYIERKKWAEEYDEEREDMDLDGIGEDETFVGVLACESGCPEFIVTEFGQIISC